MNNTEKNKTFTQSLSDREWIGVIIDNDDPLKMLRCKIRVFGLYDGLEDEHLPWAFPAASLCFSSSSGGFGSFSTPKKNTIVKVRFNNGDKYAPEYFAIQNINETLRNELSEDYENAHVICFDEDEELRILYTKGNGILLKHKDSIINIKPDDTIFLQHGNGKAIHIQKDHISIGQENKADEPAVLGEKNVDALLEISGNVQKICTAIITAANAMKGIAGSAPIFAPLLGLWQPLEIQAAAIKNSLKTITDTKTIPATRSSSVSVDGPSKI